MKQHNKNNKHRCKYKYALIDVIYPENRDLFIVLCMIPLIICFVSLIVVFSEILKLIFKYFKMTPDLHNAFILFIVGILIIVLIYIFELIYKFKNRKIIFNREWFK